MEKIDQNQFPIRHVEGEYIPRETMPTVPKDKSSEVNKARLEALSKKYDVVGISQEEANEAILRERMSRIDDILEAHDDRIIEADPILDKYKQIGKKGSPWSSDQDSFIVEGLRHENFMHSMKQGASVSLVLAGAGTSVLSSLLLGLEGTSFVSNFSVAQEALLSGSILEGVAGASYVGGPMLIVIGAGMFAYQSYKVFLNRKNTKHVQSKIKKDTPETHMPARFA